MQFAQLTIYLDNHQTLFAKKKNGYVFTNGSHRNAAVSFEEGENGFTAYESFTCHYGDIYRVAMERKIHWKPAGHDLDACGLALVAVDDN